MTTPTRVFLTGGNGFIGSHILAQLVEHNILVCCAVRTHAKGQKVLDDFALYTRLIDIVIVPDIVAPDAFNAALAGGDFDAVIHTASPFTYANSGTEGDNNLQFLEPAIKGTRNLLTAVRDHGPTVKRVIWTGSCASVIDYENLTSDPPRSYDENDWNPLTWEDAVNGDPSMAYRASKKFAELEAWAFMEKEKPHFDLVAMCPPATFGPLRHSIDRVADLNESNSRLWKVCFDSTKDGPVPYIPVHTYVDVRDLAAAHIKALLVPEAGNQRFVVAARTFGFQDICDILRRRFMVELAGRTPIGNPGTSSLPPGAYSIDSTKVKGILGIEFRALEETVVDAARCMLDIEKKEKRGLINGYYLTLESHLRESHQLKI